MIQDAFDATATRPGNPVPAAVILPGDPRRADKLLDYIDHHRMTPLAQTTANEASRIADVLAGMETSLRRENAEQLAARKGFNGLVRSITTFHQVPQADPEKSGFFKLSQKGFVSKLFTKVAQDTGNTVTSDFCVIPESLYRDPFLDPLIQDKSVTRFMKKVHHNGNPIMLGFIQCLHANRSMSTSFPVLGLDDEVLALAGSHDLGAIMSGLGKLMTEANHDMMHHLSSPVVNENVIRSVNEIDYETDLFHLVKSRTSKGDRNPDSYESWALLSHVNTWREMRSGPSGHRLEGHVDNFLESVSVLDQAMKSGGASLADRHKVCDYFLTTGAFALIRILPFSDPLMKKYMDRAERIDPGAHLCIDDWAAANLGDRVDPVPYADMSAMFHNAYRDLIRNHEYFTYSNLSEIQTATHKCITGLMAHDIKDRYHGTRLKTDAMHTASIELLAGQALSPQRYADVTSEIEAVISFIASEDTRLKAEADAKAAASPLVRAAKWLSSAFSDADDTGEEYRQFRSSIESHVVQSVLSAAATSREFAEKHAPLVRAFSQRTIMDIYGPQHVADLRAETPPAKRPLPDSEVGLMEEILMNYDDAGHPIIPAGAGNISYASIKKLDVINLDRTIAYLSSPAPAGGGLHYLRRNAADISTSIMQVISKPA